jgi:HAD superfamily hydrolase (TIGR01509 family)
MFDTPFLHGCKAVLFDFDGTLVDASEAICTSFNEVLKTRRLAPIPHDSIRPMIGRPLRDMFREVGAASEEHDLDTCVSLYRDAFLPRSISLSRLLPGVHTTVPRLASVMRLSVVTNRVSDGAWRMLHAFGLDTCFTTVVGIDRVRNGKPHPEPVLLALRELGVPGDQAVLVGDTVDDIVAAAASGVRAIGVTTGSSPREALRQAGAAHVVDRIDELLAAIDP